MTPSPHLVTPRGDRVAPVATLEVDGRRLAFHDVDAIAPVDLPVTLRILLENVARFHDGGPASDGQLGALVERRTGVPIDLYPSRVFLHDTNGVPALADLAAMRE